MMAKQAWSGQMTDSPAGDEQPDNLFHPVEGLHRLEGRFGDQAKGKALGLSSETVGKLAAGGLAVMVLIGVVVVAAIAR